LFQGVADGKTSQIGTMAVAAEMAQIELPQLGRDQLFGHLGGCFVGKMAVAAEDALLDAPGAFGVVLQQFEVMVGFEQQHVRGAHAFDDEFGRVAEVGQEADVAVAGAEQKPDRVAGIVRDGESIHQHVADFKGGAGGKDLEFQRQSERGGDGIAGKPVAVDRDAQFRRQAGKALDMVGMLVGDEDAGEAFGRAANGEEALADLASAQAGIDEEAGLVRFEVGAIAAGTAAENGESHGHARTVVPRRKAGNAF